MRKTTGNRLLDWMLNNLPPERITLRDYVALNFCGDLTVEEVLRDGELAADLPKELFRITPGSEAIQ
jgi:hypothetical protein